MGLRLWADPDTGEIIGWPGISNRYHGVRRYVFLVAEDQLVGAKVRHHMGSHDASLRLADGTSIKEIQPRDNGGLVPAASRWVTCDDAGVITASEPV